MAWPGGPAAHGSVDDVDEASPAAAGDGAAVAGTAAERRVSDDGASLLDSTDQAQFIDVANVVLDYPYGRTGVGAQDLDLPFLCICNPEGFCVNDRLKTACRARAVSGSAARRAAGDSRGNLRAAAAAAALALLAL